MTQNLAAKRDNVLELEFENFENINLNTNRIRNERRKESDHVFTQYVKSLTPNNARFTEA